MLCPAVASASLVETENGWVDDPSVDTSWFDSTEPKSEYTLSTEAQLRGLANLVNKEQFYWKPNRVESFEDVTIILSRDITLTDEWTPIGVDDQITFSGTFDGKGHTITGLEVKSDDPNSGFFGHLSGTARNLNLEGSVNSTADFSGGVAGYLGRDGMIRNCDCNVQVAGKNEVGGVVGESRGKVFACINHGEVIGASMVGGITGESRGGKVRKCGNRGLIYSNGAGSFNNSTGGVVGRSVSASNVTRCYNVGDVISSNEATGGVVGYTNSAGSSIVNCYNIGSIHIEESQVYTSGGVDLGASGSFAGMKLTGKGLPVYAGGIVGFVGTDSVRIENCYNAGRIIGADYAGGIIGKCQNEIFTSEPAEFRNNYYGKGGFDSAIAADRDNKPMKVRGAATEVYDSAFGHLSDSLGEAYMDDQAGDYGSQGYPVLIWQEKLKTEEDLAVLKHINAGVLQWLRNASLTLSREGLKHGEMILRFFNKDFAPAEKIESLPLHMEPSKNEDPQKGKTPGTDDHKRNDHTRSDR